MASESYQQQSDLELVAALNRGESAAFDCLYHRHRDWVMRLAWRFTGNHEDALDVLQETFAYFIRKFPGFQLTSAITTFLYPAVRNLSIAANRKRRRSTDNNDGLAFCEAPGSSSTGEVAADHTELEPLLSSLSTAHREVLLMRFVDDMTQPEIAAALDLPLGTVKSRLHHALSALRQLPQIVRLSAATER